MWQEKDLIWSPPTLVAHMAPGSVLSPGPSAASFEPGRCWNVCVYVFLWVFVYVHKGNRGMWLHADTCSCIYVYLFIWGGGMFVPGSQRRFSLPVFTRACVCVWDTLWWESFLFFREKMLHVVLDRRVRWGKWIKFPPLPPDSPSSSSPVWVPSLFFFQPCRRSRAQLVGTHSQVKSLGPPGPGAYFCLCNNCFPGPLERRHVCPRTVWGGDVMKDAYEAFSK